MIPVKVATAILLCQVLVRPAVEVIVLLRHHSLLCGIVRQSLMRPVKIRADALLIALTCLTGIGFAVFVPLPPTSGAGTLRSHNSPRVIGATPRGKSVGYPTDLLYGIAPTVKVSPRQTRR